MDVAKSYDVVVVGGGPAGAVAAKAAAEAGARVLLLEGRREIGRPVQCTGLLSVRGFEAAGADRDVILREIRGVFAHAPDGRRIALESPRTHAYVIDRARFDEELARRAQEAGVEIKLKAQAVGYDSGCVYIKADGHKFAVETKVLIGADGPKSGVARWAGLPLPQKTIIALQAVIPYEPEREDYVEIYVGRALAPNFFAWVVPAHPGYARVGLGTDEGSRARAYLDRWLKERFPRCEVVEFNAGAIPIGPAERTVAPGVLLVGDAAGQTKPTSGGGIYTGVSCAKIAGEVAARAALSGDASEASLSEYEQRWRKLFERELRFGMLVHQMLCSLSDDDLNKIFLAADHPAILELLSEHGDIDYPSRAAKALLKRPDLWNGLWKAAPFDLRTLVQALQTLL